MKSFKRNWIYKGVGQTKTLFGLTKSVHIWQCTITNKIKTKNVE